MPAKSPRTRGRSSEPLALILWAVVVCVSLLSVFVQVLHEQMERGEQFRQAQRAGAAPNSRGSQRKAPGSEPPLFVGASLHP